ncbi:MAG: ribonuclease R [Christensenellaceae bacterium]|jgi:ribonuclease R
MELGKKIIAFVNEVGATTEEALLAAINAEENEIKEETNQLVRAGEIIRTKRGKLASLGHAGYAKGSIDIKRGGFGFVRQTDDDIYIPAKELKGAFQNETVLAKITHTDARGKEGYVERILSKLPYEIVGTYQVKKNEQVVEEDGAGGQMFAVERKHQNKAYDGKKVLFSVMRRASAGCLPEGHVKEVLGDKDAPGVDILSVARSFGLYDAFPKAVMKEANSVPEEVDEKELNDRELLFDKAIFTIDGADAKDLDDAISLEKLQNGNQLLGVHIADVSHYVKQGSALDEEALHRGTSVYLVDQVIPMLPRRLSNGICSLHGGVVRLTLSCFMEVNAAGDVVNHRFAKTAIRSSYRLTYEGVNDLLDGNPAAEKEYASIKELLIDANKLAEVIHKKRRAEGSIDFDVPEAKIVLDEKRRPVEIVPRTQQAAEKMIEAFMVLANNTVAEDFFTHELPFIYRIHDKPDPMRMEELKSFLATIGYRNMRGGSQGLQRVLRESMGRPEENIIKTIVLRTMQKAEYNVQNRGHFGLGSSAYTHFTSPIRRYPDLIVHRLIHARLEKRKVEMDLSYIATESSAKERSAIEAERRIDEIMKAEYMEQFIGKTFQGVVSGVTNTAVFVALPNTVEGVLPLSSINDDYYVFFPELYAVVGKRRKKRIQLGDKIKVRVKSADKEIPQIEFSYVPLSKKRKK